MQKEWMHDLYTEINNLNKINKKNEIYYELKQLIDNLKFYNISCDEFV